VNPFSIFRPHHQWRIGRALFQHEMLALVLFPTLGQTCDGLVVCVHLMLMANRPNRAAYCASFVPGVKRGSSLAAHLHIFMRRAPFFASVYEWFTHRFCDCGHADARTSLDSLPQRLSKRLFAGGDHAREIPPGITFWLQTSGDSPVPADRRSRAVEHGASPPMIRMPGRLHVCYVADPKRHSTHDAAAG
jgi:hypothetical protein